MRALGRLPLVAVLNVLAVLLVCLGLGLGFALVTPLLGVAVGVGALGVGCGLLAGVVD